MEVKNVVNSQRIVWDLLGMTNINSFMNEM